MRQSRHATQTELPEAIQQQVREGQILAQVALKFLVPVARQSLEDCQRMAAIFAQHHCDVREAGQLYAAWRQGPPAIRKRILDAPELRGGYPLPVKLNGDASSSARSLTGKTVYAVIEQYFRDVARDFQLEMNPNIANPRVIDRVASVNAMLWNARGEVGCFIDPSCKELITDLFEVSWCKDNQHEIDKRRDRQRTHWSDALGYLVYKDFRPDAFRRQINPVEGQSYYAA